MADEQAPVKDSHPSTHSYKSAAWLLNCEVNAIHAVASVEAGPYGAFLSTGEPTVLFERHLFHRLTGGRFAGATAPGLPADCAVVSSPYPGGWGPVSAQHRRLQAAVDLDRDAALSSASWGLFQILGLNYKRCGYNTLQRFITAMYRSEDDHLRAFTMFIRSDSRLVDAIRGKNWRRFSGLYNGPDYEKNRHHLKMEQAYLMTLTP